jgi:hypothetical protein
VQGEYNYLRAFYTTKEAAEIDDTNDAEHLIAVWAIAGKEMIFAHVADGQLHDILSIVINYDFPLAPYLKKWYNWVYCTGGIIDENKARNYNCLAYW